MALLLLLPALIQANLTGPNICTRQEKYNNNNSNNNNSSFLLIFAHTTATIIHHRCALPARPPLGWMGEEEGRRFGTISPRISSNWAEGKEAGRQAEWMVGVCLYSRSRSKEPAEWTSILAAPPPLRTSSAPLQQQQFSSFSLLPRSIFFQRPVTRINGDGCFASHEYSFPPTVVGRFHFITEKKEGKFLCCCSLFLHLTYCTLSPPLCVW